MNFGKVLKFVWNNRQVIGAALRLIPTVEKVIPAAIVDAPFHNGANIYDVRQDIKEANPEIAKTVANNIIDLAAQIGYSTLKQKVLK